MRAHDTKYPVPFFPQLAQELPSEAAAAIVSMYDELRDPADDLVVTLPATDECLAY